LYEFNKAIFVEFIQNRDYYGKKGNIRYFYPKVIFTLNVRQLFVQNYFSKTCANNLRGSWAGQFC